MLFLPFLNKEKRNYEAFHNSFSQNQYSPTLYGFLPTIFCYYTTKNKSSESINAEVAQLVEHQLPKLRVAGSNPVFRSNFNKINRLVLPAFFIRKFEIRYYLNLSRNWDMIYLHKKDFLFAVHCKLMQAEQMP